MPTMLVKRPLGTRDTGKYALSICWELITQIQNNKANQNFVYISRATLWDHQHKQYSSESWNIDTNKTVIDLLPLGSANLSPYLIYRRDQNGRPEKRRVLNTNSLLNSEHHLNCIYPIDSVMFGTAVLHSPTKYDSVSLCQNNVSFPRIR